MPRARYQRGTLRTSVPKSGEKPERKLPRGTFWAQWYQYFKAADGTEKRRRREKIVDRDLAMKYRVVESGTAPLSKGDAQRVLDLLIAEESGTYIRPDTAATFGQVAREYIATMKPSWGPHTERTSEGLIEYSLIGSSLGNRPVAELAEIELQTFLNGHITSGASKSKLDKIVMYLRAILDYAILKKIIVANPAKSPAYKLKAKSRRRPSSRYLTIEECRRLLAAVIGPDRLIIRTLIQLGLRSEEVFVLRRDDIQGDQLRIDEAIVEGQLAPVKSDASEASVYLPPDLQAEFNLWAEAISDPRAWLFPSPKGDVWGLQNYLNRRLKPAAIRARVGVTTRTMKKGKEIETTDVNFQVLRRTCATLFGAKAKDPRDTQAQLRHADPAITLKHYQQSIPASVQAAAIAFESDLIDSQDSILNRTSREQVKN